MKYLYERILVEGADKKLEGNVYAILFEDNGRYGWFTEYRHPENKTGSGTTGETSKLFDKLTKAKISFTLKFGKNNESSTNS